MSKNIGTLLNAATAYQQRAQASRVVASWSEETASEYQKITARLLAEATALARNEQAENRNPNHSPEGRFKGVKREVESFIDGLKWLGLEKSTRETKCGNLFGELFINSIPKSTRSENAQAQRDAEIRGVVWPLPPAQRDNIYLTASEADNVEVLRALQDSPMPLISDEVRLRGDDVRAARLQPQRYRTFVEQGELLHEISAILHDCLDLGREFSLDVPPSVDELGPKIRLALDFAIDHAASRRKGKPVLHTTAKDVAGVVAETIG